MKEIKSIDRSFQNSRNEVIESDVPKSGFNLTYRNHLGGLVLGRLYPQSIQHLMPNDKFSGSNEGNLIFEKLATPVVDTMDVCSHNFMVTLRSIDKQWEKFQTPTKLNNMNNGVSVPCFDFAAIIGEVLNVFASFICSIPSNSTSSSPKVLFYGRVYSSQWQALINTWKGVYHDDSLLDLSNQIDAVLDPSISQELNLFNVSDRNKFMNILRIWLDFFIGKRSLLDYLGYICADGNMIERFLEDIFETSFEDYFEFSDGYSLMDWFYDRAKLMQVANNFVCYWNGNDNKIYPVSYPLQNEYAIRAYYAIWFEYYRNYDLEPRSANLPEYHDFGSTPILQPTFANLHYLVPRIRSWQKDIFTTAGIDDISRHVFAPILTSNYNVSMGTDTSLEPTNVVDNRIDVQSISWRNPSTGVVSTVNVPVPKRVLSQLDGTTSSTVYGLELFNLRKAQMLENYLKRIYYGGDEYRDRMLHLYGARIEDYRINRPEWLSSSLDAVDPKQEVANTGVAPTDTNPNNMPIGSRVATATAVQSGSDGFTNFSPEFGIYMSILSIMPHASYNPFIIQNLQRIGTDFPIPQFANSMEDVINTLEISRGVYRRYGAFGYAPYGHGYRGRVDEVHGDFMDTKFDYCFLRYFDYTSIPNLSYGFIHCRPDLPMFVNSVLLDGQVFGTFKHNFYVERPLPSPVEQI